MKKKLKKLKLDEMRVLVLESAIVVNREKCSVVTPAVALFIPKPYQRLFM